MKFHTFHTSMNKKNKKICCGSVKVGSRGQVVLPIELRKKLEIEEGETLFVLEDGLHIKLVKPDLIKKALDKT